MRCQSLLLIAACAGAGILVSGTARADGAANLKVMDRFYSEVCNQGRTDLIDQFMAPDFVDHEPTGFPPNRDGCRQFFTMLRTAFPDARFEKVYATADGDRVLWFGTMSGTQKGEFMGMPATGKHMKINLFDMVRFENGKAVEHWGVSGGMAMMTQLGMIPESAP